MDTLSEKLRETMRQWTTGVCIVCSGNGDLRQGMTVNSFTSISLDPPLISVTLANQSRTSHLVQESGLFSVSILNASQKHLADQFSGKNQAKRDHFDGVDTLLLPEGTIAIDGALAILECHVVDKMPLANSTMYIARVNYSEVKNSGLRLFTTTGNMDSMKNQTITNEDRQILVELARRSIEMATRNRKIPQVKLADYSQRLQSEGASFVTLTIQGNLRGCIGTLQAYQPLVKDVVEHAAAAATEDFRFTPVTPAEIPTISIEISVLSEPLKIAYNSTEDLLSQLIPGESGVIIKDGRARATFLPQVWEQLPDKFEFMSHLCSKMGAPSNLWKTKNLEVFTYQVEEFHD